MSIKIKRQKKFYLCHWKSAERWLHSTWKSAGVDCIQTDSDRQTQYPFQTLFLVRNAYLLFSPNFSFTGRALIFARYSM